MKRILRWLIALGLMPICIGATRTALEVLTGSLAVREFWIAFAGGAVAWMVVFLTLPKPLWLYVVGHELTHAVWGILFGARVRSLRATSKGGQVVLSHTNTLIALAPYFFPFYTAILTVFALMIRWWWPHPWVDPLFHFGLGCTYAFHATLTLWILRIRQSDISGEGYLLSAMIIWLGNVLVGILAVPALTGNSSCIVTLTTTFEYTGRTLDFILNGAAHALHRFLMMRVG